jgi:integrase
LETAAPPKVALTEEGLNRMRACLAGSVDTRKYDLVDIVEALSGSGCRIGELLELEWPRIDIVAWTIAIDGTVIRVPGEGLIVRPRTKSRTSMRTITPPRWLMLLRERHTDFHGP